MPDLSSLVPSLDTCHRLVGAGFPQDTALGWNLRVGRNTGYGTLVVSVPYPSRQGFDCAAPTLAELWAQMPDSIGYEGEVYDLVHVRGGGKERMGYLSFDDVVLQIREGGTARHRLWSEGEVVEEVAAALALTLAEAGHLSPSDHA